MKTIQANGKILCFDSPVIMGILNLTPDSFFDGGKYNVENALFQTEKMLEEGAKIIDLGAYSTRPKADFVSEEEEKQRLLPILEQIRRHFPEIFISIDTFRAKIAGEALEIGADIINDVSGGNQALFETVAAYQVPYILMHSSEDIENLTKILDYKEIVFDLVQFFQKKISHIRKAGIKDIILDLGFGFGKSIDQNYELLYRLNEFSLFDLPLLVGISRKSMIWRKLNISPQEALNATTALHSLAVSKGANILRVHDVKETQEVLKVLEMKGL